MSKNFKNILQDPSNVEQNLNNNSWVEIETGWEPENAPVVVQKSPVDSLIREKFRNRIKSNRERSSSYISNLWKRREDVDRILGKPDCEISSSDDSLATKDLAKQAEPEKDYLKHSNSKSDGSSSLMSDEVPSDDCSDKTVNTSSISALTSRNEDEVEKLNLTRYSNANDFPESVLVDLVQEIQQNSHYENGREPTDKESDLHSENLMLFTPKNLVENELVVFGQVVIRKIAFSSIKHFLNVKERFMLLVHNGKRIFETEIVAIDENGNIEFVKDIILNELDDDFEFVLKLCCKTEEKPIAPVRFFKLLFPFWPEKSRTTCLFSVKRLFKKKKNFNRKVSNTFSDSPYKTVGICKINIGNLRGSKMLEFVENGQNSSITKSFEFEFSDDIIFRGCTTGYLSIATELIDGLNWNYYWCTLDGWMFKYYNYPLQEVPEGIIDLRYCVDAFISEPKREMCPRVKTLLVEVGQNRQAKDKASLLTVCHSHSTIVMYLLSTDSKSEFEKWKRKLNMVLSAIRNWNKTKFSLRFTKVTEL